MNEPTFSNTYLLAHKKSAKGGSEHPSQSKIPIKPLFSETQIYASFPEGTDGTAAASKAGPWP